MLTSRVLNFQAISAHIGVEPIMMKKGFIRIFPHLGLGYNWFSIKETEDLGFSVDSLPKKTFHNLSINLGGGMALHIYKKWELRFRYTACSPKKGDKQLNQRTTDGFDETICLPYQYIPRNSH